MADDVLSLPVEPPPSSSLLPQSSPQAPVSQSNPISLTHSSSLSWKALFSKPNHNEKPFPPPSYLEDGTPLIHAPSDILLKSSETWKGYLLCIFFGDPPPAAKIYADLNPIWGKGGSITVRHFTEGSCLIHIPSISTRQWICKVGFWSAGTVAFSVVEWSPSATFHNRVLKSAPLCVTLTEIPPQLWTEAGAKFIASGFGTAVPHSRVLLPTSSLGTAKLRVITDLEKPLPSCVMVEDKMGVRVSIGVAFHRLPPKCASCSAFGHQEHRCPHRRRSNHSTSSVQSGAREDCPNPTVPHSQASSVKPSNISQPIPSIQPISQIPKPLDPSVDSQASVADDLVGLTSIGPDCTRSDPSPSHPLSSPPRPSSLQSQPQPPLLFVDEPSAVPPPPTIISNPCVPVTGSHTIISEAVHPSSTISLNRDSHPSCPTPQVTNFGSLPPSHLTSNSSLNCDQSLADSFVTLLLQQEHQTTPSSGHENSPSRDTQSSSLISISDTSTDSSSLSLHPSSTKAPSSPITEGYNKTPLHIRDKVKELILKQLEEEEEEDSLAAAQKLKDQELLSPADRKRGKKNRKQQRLAAYNAATAAAIHR